MEDENTKLERIETLIEQYLNSFGQARIAMYVFSGLESHNDFTRFLNAFISILKRANCRPVYSWVYDSCRGHYNLLLIVNGYFRNDMKDVTDAAQRIWSLYSSIPPQFVVEMPISSVSLPQDKMRLMEIMNEIQFTSLMPQRILPPHQRAFACSRLS